MRMPASRVKAFRKVVPERVDRLSWKNGSYGICPALSDEFSVCLARFWEKQRVVHPAFWLLSITLGRDDVVILCLNDESFFVKSVATYLDNRANHCDL